MGPPRAEQRTTREAAKGAAKLATEVKLVQEGSEGINTAMLHCFTFNSNAARRPIRIEPPNPCTALSGSLVLSGAPLGKEWRQRLVPSPFALQDPPKQRPSSSVSAAIEISLAADAHVITAGQGLGTGR